MDWSQTLGTPTRPVDNTPKTFEMTAWHTLTDPERMAAIERIARHSAENDPAIAQAAVSIFRAYNVPPRQYRQQIEALLHWIQRAVYYVNERDEKLQDPAYTLRHLQGDCDDMAILLYALAHSVRLPARIVISGTDPRGKIVRFKLGDTYPRNVRWSHIYLELGDHPYGQHTWHYAEPTLHVPLGWDVAGANGQLPEFGDTRPHRYYQEGGVLNLNWTELAIGIGISVATGLIVQSVLEAVRNSRKVA